MAATRGAAPETTPASSATSVAGQADEQDAALSWVPLGWEPSLPTVDDAPFGSVLGDPLPGPFMFDASVLDAAPGAAPSAVEASGSTSSYGLMPGAPRSRGEAAPASQSRRGARSRRLAGTTAVPARQQPGAPAAAAGRASSRQTVLGDGAAMRTRPAGELSQQERAYWRAQVEEQRRQRRQQQGRLKATAGSGYAPAEVRAAAARRARRAQREAEEARKAAEEEAREAAEREKDARAFRNWFWALVILGFIVLRGCI
ncbi:hypothetical protein [Actinomyces urogenitalis]|uniref:hypothetical protein n=1 Tax=Actinomyces urogenitalis TaxID=103621 RepID=UPI0012E002EA|nr:hypothetical protein [Actinomyces urogenitalis]